MSARRIAPVPEGFRGALAAADYDGPFGVALQRAKYGRRRSSLRLLAEAFASSMAPWVIGGFDAVVDVPSPWTRRLDRGFSTGALLGGALARQIGVPLRHVLSLKPGARNAGLSAPGRRANLVGRLRASRPVPGRVLVVDDVVTTGATSAACARELLGNATDEVWLACLCWARPPAP